MAPKIQSLSVLSRLLTRPKTGKDDPSDYFGPGVEIAPIMPPNTDGRAWQYWPFQNQNFIPRPDASYTAQELRDLATYPLARILIENCKDIVCQMPRQIRPKKKPGETNKDVDKRGQGDPALKMLNEFLDCPDGEHDWSDWVRPWLEDLYVIDAASWEVHRDGKGKVAELSWTDGAFINRIIDERGRTPRAPLPAYQQLWSGTPGTVGGIPFVNYSSQQLIYSPRNIVPRSTVSSFLYGMSQTEQLATEIKIGIERLYFVLFYYTTGTLPDVYHVIPPNVQVDQIKVTQKAIEAEMSGQNNKRSGAIRLIQGFVDRTQAGSSQGDQFYAPKEKLLADPFDDLHIHKLGYGYGASVQRLLKQLNRATANSNQEAAEEEGTQPISDFLKSRIDWVIAKIFNLGFNSYELTFDQPLELDPVKRSTADKNDVDSGILTRDEVRLARGIDPVGGDAATLMITTTQGTVPVDMKAQVDQAKAMAEAIPKPEPAQGGGNSKKKVGKAFAPKIDPGRSTPDTRQARARLESALLKIFASQKEKATTTARRILKVRKADDPEKKADEIYRAIEAEFALLPVEARAALEQAARAGIADAIIQIEITDGGMISSINTIAADYASKRAAEMVGMKYNANGELVTNPNAKYAISDTTRDRLREIVKNAYEKETAYSEIIEQIQDADIFSESRARMIAKTETATAQVQSNFNVWQTSGLVTKVKWLAVGPDPCPICEDNDGVIREIGDQFPSGDRYPLAHPRCYCILEAVGFAE